MAGPVLVVGAICGHPGDDLHSAHGGGGKPTVGVNGRQGGGMACGIGDRPGDRRAGGTGGGQVMGSQGQAPGDGGELQIGIPQGPIVLNDAHMVVVDEELAVVVGTGGPQDHRARGGTPVHIHQEDAAANDDPIGGVRLGVMVDAPHQGLVGIPGDGSGRQDGGQGDIAGDVAEGVALGEADAICCGTDLGRGLLPLAGEEGAALETEGGKEAIGDAVIIGIGGAAVVGAAAGAVVVVIEEGRGLIVIPKVPGTEGVPRCGDVPVHLPCRGYLIMCIGQGQLIYGDG